jgi:hypothetical protein
MNYQNMLRYAQLGVELRDIQAHHSDDPEPLTEFYARLDAARSALSSSELSAVALLVGKSSLCLHCHYGHQRISLGSSGLCLEAVCSDSCAQALLENSTEDEEYCVGCDCFND